MRPTFVIVLASLLGCGSARTDADDGDASGGGSSTDEVATAGTANDASDDRDPASSGAGTSSGVGESQGVDTSSGSDDGVDPGCEWQVEVVDVDHAGADADIVAFGDRLDVLYLGGQWPAVQELRHAQRDGDAWNVAVVADTRAMEDPQPFRAGVMLDASITDAGGLRVGFRNGGYRPGHATYADGQWSVEPWVHVLLGTQHLQPAVAVAADDAALFAFRTNMLDTGTFVPGGTLALAREEAGTWSVESIPQTSWQRGPLALARVEEVLHLAVVPDDVGAPVHASGDDAWAFAPIDPELEHASALELAVAPDGALHVAIAGGGTQRAPGIYHGSFDGTQWSVALVEEVELDPAAFQQRLGLAIARDGDVHLAYTTMVGFAYARGTAGAWSREVVNADGGDHGGLALDGDARPHLVMRSRDAVPQLLHAQRACR